MTFYFDSDVPLYLQVAEQIENGILTGAYPEETQVPSTTEISVAYQLNPATVLKGVTMLVDRGLLYKKRGIGMFVEKGAKEKIKEQKQQAFYDNYIVRLLDEAKKIDIDKDTILKMIREER